MEENSRASEQKEGRDVGRVGDKQNELSQRSRLERGAESRGIANRKKHEINKVIRARESNGGYGEKMRSDEGRDRT